MGDVNKVFLDKIVNLLKKDIYYKDGKLYFEIYLSNGESPSINRLSGINILLKTDGYLHNYLIDYLIEQYGLNKEECDSVWLRLTKDLKKENFVDSLGWVLFEDYIIYEEDPYRVRDYEERVYNLRDFQQFKKFVKNVSGGDNHDPHSDISYNFISMMDDHDYKHVYNYIMNRIEENL